MIYQRRNLAFKQVNGCYKTNMSLRLLTVPEFPTKLLAGENHFTLRSTSLLKPPQEVTSYRFSIPELELNDLESTGDFTLTIDPSYVGRQLLVTGLHAVDILQNRSRIVGVYTQITDWYIKTPVILAPVNTVTIYSHSFPVVGDEFTVISSGSEASGSERHVSTDIKITRDVEGLHIVFRKYGIMQPNLETYNVTRQLNAGQYYIFMRYNGGRQKSSWSSPVLITIPQIVS